MCSFKVASEKFPHDAILVVMVSLNFNKGSKDLIFCELSFLIIRNHSSTAEPTLGKPSYKETEKTGCKITNVV